MKGLVFNIQRFSIHDGPGIRTTVFLKGCNLRCFWCHNPESINAKPEILFYSDKCIGCKECFKVCPENVHKVQNKQKVILRDLCIGCGKCTDICYAEALIMSGKYMSVKKVMDEVVKDKAFYENSNGGVTLSGGEALLQPDFAKEILKECKKENLHTTVDTAGCVPWQNFKQILPYTDLFLYDIKTVDNVKHKKATGTGNKRILENLKKLSKTGVKITIRIPVIPGINDGVKQMKKIADFIYDLENIDLIELLPFHRFGEEKYKSLDMPYKAKGLKPPTDEKMQRLAKSLKSTGYDVKIS